MCVTERRAPSYTLESNTLCSNLHITTVKLIFSYLFSASVKWVVENTNRLKSCIESVG